MNRQQRRAGSYKEEPTVGERRWYVTRFIIVECLKDVITGFLFTAGGVLALMAFTHYV